MKSTVMLLSPSADHIELVARLRRAGSYTDDGAFDRLDRPGGSFSLDVGSNLEHSYEEEEIVELGKRLGAFDAIALEYPDMTSVRDLLFEVLDGLPGLLDTDYDELISYDEVLARFRREPAWDWRSWS